MRWLSVLFLMISAVSAQIVQTDAGTDVRTDIRTDYNFHFDAKDMNVAVFQEDSLKIVEVWGVFRIKDEAARDSVRSFEGKWITKTQFEALKEFIVDKAKRRGREVEVRIYRLEGNNVRLEIERRYRISDRRDWDDDDWDPNWDWDDNDDEGEGEAYGVGYLLDIMIPLSESDEDDVIAIGYRAEFEHNFYRGFFGIEYQVNFDDALQFRLGSGFTQQGVFMFNYAFSDDDDSGGLAKLSYGELTRYLRLTPQHIHGQTYINTAIGKLDVLMNHHALRLSYGFQDKDNAFKDTLGISDEQQMDGFSAEYSMTYLDNINYPLSGVYLNLKYQTNYFKEKIDRVPYDMGNEFATGLLRKGNKMESAFANLHVLIPFKETTALHFGGQAVMQEFNTSNFTLENPVAVDRLQLNPQKQLMWTATAAIRQRFDEDEILSLGFGHNQIKFEDTIVGEIKDQFIEFSYNSDALEIKYTYIFNREVDNPNNIADFERLIHHDTGMFFSIGMSLGSLY